MKSQAPKIAVVGSLNVDYTAFVARLPRPGETVSATNLVRRFGGKGANQALAAARQGARVAMIGAVGGDADGRSYREYFSAQSIDCGGVAVVKGVPTGTAWIAVDAAAENFIVVVPGANGTLTPAAVRRQRTRIESSDALLLQWEVPHPALLEAIRIASRAGVRVVMNPSPLRDGFPWGEVRLDTVIVNAGEAASLFGIDFRGGVKLSAGLLDEFGIGRLIVTRGAKSTMLISDSHVVEVPTMRVTPVDTVGAGDAFAGTFAARIAAGEEASAAVAAANCAAALATLKIGAQEAIPTRSATDRARARLVRG